MGKIKKILCMLLVITVVIAPCSLLGNVFAQTGNSIPLTVEVTTDKSSYTAYGIAEITVNVKNTSNETVNNISAEAVFNDLSPVGKNNETSKEIESLKSGESFSFSYKATVNASKVKLNFFEKIILWFVRLFNGGYSATGNSFDDNRDFVSKTNIINFGKYSVKNEIIIEYGNVNDNEDDWLYTVDDEHVVITDENGNGYINNEILLMCEPNITEEEVYEIVESIDGQIVGNNHPIYQVKVLAKSEDELETLCDRLEQNSMVFSAHISRIFTEERTDLEASNIYAIPNDPWTDKIQGITGTDWDENNSDGLNWWLEAIEAPSAWDYNKYFTNVKIGIEDDGFDTQHEDLKITVLNDKVNSSENHGTHVAGIIGATANNNKGITGIVWNAELYGHDWKPTNKQEKKHIRVDNSYVGIENLLKKGAKIINLSSGTDLEDNKEDIYQSGYNAVDWIVYYKYKLGYKDFLIIQAAGNRNCDSIRSGLFNCITDEIIKDYISDKDLEKYITPSNIYSSFIIVGAIKNEKDNYEIANGLTYHTCYGEKISIVAPGEDVFSTIKTGGLNGSYGKKTGTSMAAPIVSGVTALVWSVNPNFTSGEVKEIVCNYTNKTAKGYGDDTRTYPIVNAKLAVEESIKRTCNGIVTGTVKDKTTNNTISGVSVSAIIPDSNSTTPVATTTTDENGDFSLSLPNGTYALIFTHDDYENYGWEISVNNDSVLLSENVLLTRKTALLKSTVKDKDTDVPIAGVIIEAIDNTSGSLDPVAIATTDENGQFSINVPYGSNSLCFTHENYENYEKTVSINSSNNLFVKLLFQAEPILLTAKDSSSDVELATFLGKDISEVIKEYGNNYVEESIEGGHYYIYNNLLAFVITENAFAGFEPQNVVSIVSRSTNEILYNSLHSNMSYNDLIKIVPDIEKPQYYYDEIHDEVIYFTTFKYGNYIFNYRWKDYPSDDEICYEVIVNIAEYCDIYVGDILSVSGTLKTEDYEINSNNKGTVYILNLEQPIYAKLYSDVYNGTFELINSVQINSENLDSFINDNITISGSVMFGHSGHHLRTIILTDCNITTQNINLYSEVINEYSNFLSNKESNIENPYQYAFDYANNSKYLNEFALLSNVYDNSPIFYILYDIDNNGTLDLLIGNNENNIFDIFTYADETIYRFSNDINSFVNFGERSSLHIVNDVLIVYGSGGADFQVWDFYKYSSDGHTPILYDSISLINGIFYRGENEDSENILTKDEANSICKNYTGKNLFEIETQINSEWKEIK